MYEVSMVGGNPHWEALIQGMESRFSRLTRPQNKRYTKKEFDKWFAGYDAIVEIPSFFDTDCLEAYAEDPDVKFILVERTPQSWTASFNRFIGGILQAIESPPFSIFKYFNRTFSYFCISNVYLYNLWAEGTRPGEPGNTEALIRNYERYIREAKRVMPADRTLILKMEDGLGWEEVCDFLGKEVPKGVAYPRAVEHEDLKDKFLMPLIKDAMIKLGLTVTLPIALGIGLWWKFKSQ